MIKESNFTMYRGDYIKLNIEIFDENNDIVATSGKTATYFFGSNQKEMFVKNEKDGSIDILESDNGTLLVIIKIDELDTRGLSPGNYYHELKIRDINGMPSTVMTGRVTIINTRIK